VQTLAALVLIAAGLACALLGVIAIVTVRRFELRPRVIRQSWREMKRPDTPIFDTPVARRAMDDIAHGVHSLPQP